MSFSFRDKVYSFSKESIYVGIVIVCLGIAGVMMPFLYDGNVANTYAVTFSTTSTVYTGDVGGSNPPQIIWNDGVYYTFFSVQSDYNADSGYEMVMTTSTDGSSWSATSTVMVSPSSSINVIPFFDVAYDEYHDHFGIVVSWHDNNQSFETEGTWFATSTNGFTWSATTSIHDSNTDGEIPQLAFSSTSEFAAIAFYTYDDNDFTYVYITTSTDGSSWSATSTVAESLNADNFLGIKDLKISGEAGSEIVHVLYNLLTLGDTYYTYDYLYASSTDFGGSWTTTTVVSDYAHESYTYSGYTSLYIDVNGNPAFAYYDILDKTCDGVYSDDEWSGNCNSTSSLKLAQKSGGTWTTNTVIDSLTASLSGDGDNTRLGSAPHLLFYNTDDILVTYVGDNLYPKLAINTSTFNTSTIESAAVFNTDPYVGMDMSYNSTNEEVGIIYFDTAGSLVFTTTSLAAAPTVLDPPDNLANTPSATSQIDLSWDAVSGATGYVLYRDTNSGFTATTTVTTTVLTSYSDTDLTYGTTYYYKVATVNGVGTGIASASVNTSTLDWDGSLSTVPNVDTNSFTRLIYANSKYYYFYSNSPDGDYNIYLTTSTNGVSWSDPNEIVSTIKPMADPIKPAYDIQYNSTDDYFGMAYYVSSTGAMVFTTSSDGVTWASNVSIYTEDTDDNVFMSNLSIWNGSDYIAIGYGKNEVAYSSDTGASWATSSLGISDESESLLNIAIDSSGYLHMAYVDENATSFVYASSTDSGDTWSSSTIYAASDYDWGHDKFMLDANERPVLLFGDRTEGSYTASTGTMYLSALEDGVWSESEIGEIAFTYTTDSEMAFSDLNFYGARPYMVYVGESSYPDFAYSTSTADPFTMNISQDYGSNSEVVGELGRMSVTYDSANTTAAVAYVNSDGELKFVTSSVDLSESALGGIPSIATSTPATDTITLEWDAVSGASTYTVSSTVETASTTSNTSITYGDLSPNTQYTFQVLATDAYSNSSDYSDTTSTYTNADTPGTPSATATGQTTMTVSWDANSNGTGTTYELYNVTDSSIVDTTTDTSYSVTGLTADTSYTFKVRALYLSDDSTYTSYSASSAAVSTDAESSSSSGGGAAPAPAPPSTPSTAAPATVSIMTVPGVSQAVSVGNTSHTVTASAPAADGSVTIVVQSDPVTIVLKPGEEELIDTNSDNEDDLFVRLDSVDGSNSHMTIAAIDDLEISINKALSTTDSRDVTLYFNSPESTQMAISNTSDFSQISFESYKETVSWKLTPGNGIKTVSVKLRTSSGGTRVVSDTITLTGQDTDEVVTTCPVDIDKAYKSADSNGVYYVDYAHNVDGSIDTSIPCAKRSFTRASTYFTYYSSWSDVTVIDAATLDAIPRDVLKFMPKGPRYNPQYGAIVKTITDPKVYLLLGTEKYWITSPVVFEALGYAWGWIEDVAQSLLDEYTTASEIDYTDHHPNHTLIKYPDSPKVYKLENNTKRWVKNEAAFDRLGYRWDRIVTISSDEVYDDGDILE